MRAIVLFACALSGCSSSPVANGDGAVHAFDGASPVANGDGAEHAFDGALLSDAGVAACDAQAMEVWCGGLLCKAGQVCARYYPGGPPQGDMQFQPPSDFCMTLPTACVCDQTCECINQHQGHMVGCDVPGAAQFQCFRGRDCDSCLGCYGN